MPKELRHLAWLDLNGDGAEYWAAMELMGQYASANHHIIHQLIARAVGKRVLLQVENHHNFAWKEHHLGREVIVHRKGATPADLGTLGIIPGSMAAPGFVVRGKGNPASLNSAAHGAGRRMSRTQAKKTYWGETVQSDLKKEGIIVKAASMPVIAEEAPGAYKDINNVVNVSHKAGISKKIVKLRPLAVAKG